MKQTLRLGRIAGISVGVHWSVLVIVALLAQSLALVVLPATEPGQPTWSYWLVALVATALFVASLLAHELAHALVARRYRIRVERVTLWLLGGVAEFGDRPATPRVDLRVALVGPLTSLAAALVFFTTATTTAGWLPSVAVAALTWLSAVNLLLAAFNLLPAAPLDGGRVLRAVLWRRWGDRIRADVAAARAGRGLGGGLIAIGLLQLLAGGNLGGLWFAVLGWFLLAAAGVEQRSAELTRLLGDLPVRAAMDPRPAAGLVYQNVQEFLDMIVWPPRYRAFPVVEPGGRPVGTVHLAALAQVPVPMRPRTSLESVMARAGTAVEADRPLADVAAQIAPGTDPLPVVAHGVLVGVLDAAGIARAIDLARLGMLTPSA